MFIETVMFRLAAGATEQVFLTADADAQVRFVYQQPGLCRRTTARGENGAWITITVWDSAEQAAAAAEAATTNVTHAALAATVDPASVVSARWTVLD